LSCTACRGLGAEALSDPPNDRCGTLLPVPTREPVPGRARECRRAGLTALPFTRSARRTRHPAGGLKDSDGRPTTSRHLSLLAWASPSERGRRRPWQADDRSAPLLKRKTSSDSPLKIQRTSDESVDSDRATTFAVQEVTKMAGKRVTVIFTVNDREEEYSSGET
jgi:hypothetical protein